MTKKNQCYENSSFPNITSNFESLFSPQYLPAWFRKQLKKWETYNPNSSFPTCFPLSAEKVPNSLPSNNTRSLSRNQKNLTVLPYCPLDRISSVSSGLSPLLNTLRLSDTTFGSINKVSGKGYSPSSSRRLPPHPPNRIKSVGTLAGSSHNNLNHSSLVQADARLILNYSNASSINISLPFEGKTLKPSIQFESRRNDFEDFHRLNEDEQKKRFKSVLVKRYTFKEMLEMRKAAEKVEKSSKACRMPPEELEALIFRYAFDPRDLLTYRLVNKSGLNYYRQAIKMIYDALKSYPSDRLGSKCFEDVLRNCAGNWEYGNLKGTNHGEWTVWLFDSHESRQAEKLPASVGLILGMRRHIVLCGMCQAVQIDGLKVMYHEATCLVVPRDTRDSGGTGAFYKFLQEEENSKACRPNETCKSVEKRTKSLISNSNEESFDNNVSHAKSHGVHSESIKQEILKNFYFHNKRETPTLVSDIDELKSNSVSLNFNSVLPVTPYFSDNCNAAENGDSSHYLSGAGGCGHEALCVKHIKKNVVYCNNSSNNDYNNELRECIHDAKAEKKPANSKKSIFSAYSDCKEERRYNNSYSKFLENRENIPLNKCLVYLEPKTVERNAEFNDTAKKGIARASRSNVNYSKQKNCREKKKNVLTKYMRACPCLDSNLNTYSLPNMPHSAYVDRYGPLWSPAKDFLCAFQQENINTSIALSYVWPLPKAPRAFDLVKKAEKECPQWISDPQRGFVFEILSVSCTEGTKRLPPNPLATEPGGGNIVIYRTAESWIETLVHARLWKYLFVALDEGKEKALQFVHSYDRQIPRLPFNWDGYFANANTTRFFPGVYGSLIPAFKLPPKNQFVTLRSNVFDQLIDSAVDCLRRKPGNDTSFKTFVPSYQKCELKNVSLMSCRAMNSESEEAEDMHSGSSRPIEFSLRTPSPWNQRRIQVEQRMGLLPTNKQYRLLQNSPSPALMHSKNQSFYCRLSITSDSSLASELSFDRGAPRTPLHPAIRRKRRAPLRMDWIEQWCSPQEGEIPRVVVPCFPHREKGGEIDEAILVGSSRSGGNNCDESAASRVGEAFSTQNLTVRSEVEGGEEAEVRGEWNFLSTFGESIQNFEDAETRNPGDFTKQPTITNFNLDEYRNIIGSTETPAFQEEEEKSCGFSTFRQGEVSIITRTPQRKQKLSNNFSQTLKNINITDLYNYQAKSPLNSIPVGGSSLGGEADLSSQCGISYVEIDSAVCNSSEVRHVEEFDIISSLHYSLPCFELPRSSESKQAEMNAEASRNDSLVCKGRGGAVSTQKDSREAAKFEQTFEGSKERVEGNSLNDVEFFRSISLGDNSRDFCSFASQFLCMNHDKESEFELKELHTLEPNEIDRVIMSRNDKNDELTRKKSVTNAGKESANSYFLQASNAENVSYCKDKDTYSSSTTNAMADSLINFSSNPKCVASANTKKTSLSANFNADISDCITRMPSSNFYDFHASLNMFNEDQPTFSPIKPHTTEVHSDTLSSGLSPLLQKMRLQRKQSEIALTNLQDDEAFAHFTAKFEKNVSMNSSISRRRRNSSNSSSRRRNSSSSSSRRRNSSSGISNSSSGIINSSSGISNSSSGIINSSSGIGNSSSGISNSSSGISNSSSDSKLEKATLLIKDKEKIECRTKFTEVLRPHSNNNNNNKFQEVENLLEEKSFLQSRSRGLFSTNLILAECAAVTSCDDNYYREAEKGICSNQAGNLELQKKPNFFPLESKKPCFTLLHENKDACTKAAGYCSSKGSAVSSNGSFNNKYGDYNDDDSKGGGIKEKEKEKGKGKEEKGKGKGEKGKEEKGKEGKGKEEKGKEGKRKEEKGKGKEEKGKGKEEKGKGKGEKGEKGEKGKRKEEKGGKGEKEKTEEKKNNTLFLSSATKNSCFPADYLSFPKERNIAFLDSITNTVRDFGVSPSADTSFEKVAVAESQGNNSFFPSAATTQMNSPLRRINSTFLSDCDILSSSSVEEEDAAQKKKLLKTKAETIPNIRASYHEDKFMNYYSSSFFLSTANNANDLKNSTDSCCNINPRSSRQNLLFINKKPDASTLTNKQTDRSSILSSPYPLFETTNFRSHSNGSLNFLEKCETFGVHCRNINAADIPPFSTSSCIHYYSNNQKDNFLVKSKTTLSNRVHDNNSNINEIKFDPNLLNDLELCQKIEDSNEFKNYAFKVREYQKKQEVEMKNDKQQQQPSTMLPLLKKYNRKKNENFFTNLKTKGNDIKRRILQSSNAKVRDVKTNEKEKSVVHFTTVKVNNQNRRVETTLSKTQIEDKGKLGECINIKRYNLRCRRNDISFPACLPSASSSSSNTSLSKKMNNSSSSNIKSMSGNYSSSGNILECGKRKNQKNLSLTNLGSPKVLCGTMETCKDEEPVSNQNKESKEERKNEIKARRKKEIQVNSYSYLGSKKINSDEKGSVLDESEGSRQGRNIQKRIFVTCEKNKKDSTNTMREERIEKEAVRNAKRLVKGKNLKEGTNAYNTEGFSNGNSCVAETKKSNDLCSRALSLLTSNLSLCSKESAPINNKSSNYFTKAAKPAAAAAAENAKNVKKLYPAKISSKKNVAKPKSIILLSTIKDESNQNEKDFLNSFSRTRSAYTRLPSATLRSKQLKKKIHSLKSSTSLLSSNASLNHADSRNRSKSSLSSAKKKASSVEKFPKKIFKNT